MKKLLFGLSILGLITSYTTLAQANGCFICSGGGYVQYTGDDTFEKRKKAKEQFGCEVSGTTSSCSNPKGTVGQYSKDAKQRVAQNEKQ